MTAIPDITIIGCGILGMLTAREFSNAGATVSILEKNRPGQESSWAGGGILLPLYPWRQNPAISELTLHSLALYPELSRELIASTGIDPEWRQTGLLITKNPDFDTLITWCRDHHIPFAAPDDALLAQFCTEAVNPVHLPTIAQARNPRLLKALRQDMSNRNIVIHENCALLDLEIEQNKVRKVRTSGGTTLVNHVVMTTGAWSGELWQHLLPWDANLQPRINPVKGQMLLFESRPETLQTMILDDDCYLIPRIDGKILVGSTVEHCGFDKTTSDEACKQLTSFARRLFPVLADCPMIEHWAGLRPGTDHGIPYIDTHPEFNNLSINAGHFRNGLAMGPASAQLLVDRVLNRPPHIPPEPYRLAKQH